MDDEFGKIAVDYEGTDIEGETIVLSKENIYKQERASKIKQSIE